MREAAFLAELCHHRWTLPTLAHWAEPGGGRVAELASTLGASRGGVRQAVDALVRLGLVARAPGHGHPLRPEFVLTPRGRRAAAVARRIVTLTRRWSIQEHAFRKWPLPVLYGLGEEGARFSELRDAVSGITDRALSLALHALASAGLAERRVHATRPPSVEYVPTARAGELRPLLLRLAEAA